MAPGWTEVIQMVLLAVASWYVRKGSKRDAEKVIRSSAAQSTSNEILHRVERIELDVGLLKRVVMKEGNGMDHRGPKKGALS